MTDLLILSRSITGHKRRRRLFKRLAGLSATTLILAITAVVVLALTLGIELK